MRKIFNLLFITCVLSLALTSCGKGVDMGKIDDLYVVVTQKEKDFDFAGKKTYYIEDRVYLYDDINTQTNSRWIYNVDEKANEMLDRINQKMQSRGYVRSYELTPQVDFTMAVVYFWRVDEPVVREWWIDWYNWNMDWLWNYFPKATWQYYVYEVGTFEIIMVDNKTEAITIKDDVELKPVVWQASAMGLSDLEHDYRLDRVEIAINQAFLQSPYLTPNKQ